MTPTNDTLDRYLMRWLAGRGAPLSRDQVVQEAREDDVFDGTDLAGEGDRQRDALLERLDHLHREGRVKTVTEGASDGQDGYVVADLGDRSMERR